MTINTRVKLISLYEYNIGQRDTVTEIETTYILDKRKIKKNNFQTLDVIIVEPWLYGVKIDNIEDDSNNFTIYKAALDTDDLLYTASFERLADIISDNDKMDKYLNHFTSNDFFLVSTSFVLATSESHPHTPGYTQQSSHYC